jgi:hypothetical protein
VRKWLPTPLSTPIAVDAVFVKMPETIAAVEDDAVHAWRKGLSPEERKKIDEFYRQRYGN